METIVAAAIRVRVPDEFARQRWQGKPMYPSHVIVTSPPPARHATLLHPVANLQSIGPDDQGFLTSTGRFVGRVEALALVLVADQKQIDHPAKNARPRPGRARTTRRGMMVADRLFRTGERLTGIWWLVTERTWWGHFRVVIMVEIEEDWEDGIPPPPMAARKPPQRHLSSRPARPDEALMLQVLGPPLFTFKPHPPAILRGRGDTEDD